jgi:CubicO group peptidase (beta-lactamase class C family)
VVENTPEKTVLGKPARPITVRDCLCHISGLPFNVGPEGAFIDRFTLKEAGLMYALTPLNAQPGAVYAYSNAGINTAARVAEVATGRRYDDLMHERLLDPLGMRDTVMVPDRAQVARLAKTYRGDPNGTLQEIPVPQLTHPLDLRTRQSSPAGGYISGADDCARFGRMLLGDGVFHGRRVMAASAVREMLRKQTGALENRYGLGMSIHPDGFGHGGAISTNLHIDPKRGIIHVYLVQQAGYAGPDGAKVFPAFHAAANALAP